MPEERKKTVLLTFGYQRKGWIAPFEALKNKFNFVYLQFIYREEEEACFTDCKKIYWSDYRDAYQILDEIKPDKIAFMSVSSGLNIVLNLAARNRNIPTYIIQHGLFTTYADYRARRGKIAQSFIGTTTSVKNTDPSGLNNKRPFSTLNFIRNTVNLKDVFKLVKLPLYLYLLRKEDWRYAALHVQFTARKPDYYICYTYKNAAIHIELDKPRRDQILIIGNPEFDPFIQKYNNLPNEEGNYYLHIDQPFTGNRFEAAEALVTRQQMIEFWLKLNAFCKSEKAKLKIKLHPESFKSGWLPQDDNIEWIRETDNMVELIKFSKGCFGFFSTLLIPAVYFKKTILFKLTDSNFQNDLFNLGLINLLDFDRFQPKDIRFDLLEKNELNKLQFENDYFFKTDGKAIQRLEEVLKT